jgi:hypothetical protein
MEMKFVAEFKASIAPLLNQINREKNAIEIKTNSLFLNFSL